MVATLGLRICPSSWSRQRSVVPHEAVQEPGELGEVVFFEHAGGVLDGRLQAGENPLVFESEQVLVHRELGGESAGLFELRVKETAGVPQLVAEVTADFELFAGVDFAAIRLLFLLPSGQRK